MNDRPLVTVHLWSGLRALADGRQSVEVRARNVGEVLNGLVAAHPGLEDAIEAGVSVSVDGRIITSGLMEAVQPDSEIFLMQRLKGG
ncbi:MAG: MoaD/ThiS family protein [Rhodobacteraceae bacterium]|nr:MoaD/ThiS family protein [Paracoccaceae bacterium]